MKEKVYAFLGSTGVSRLLSFKNGMLHTWQCLNPVEGQTAPDRQRTYDVTLKRFPVTVVAAERQ